MMSRQEPLLLTRTDRARNLARFYMLSVERALLAGAALLRPWRRIGTRGRTRVGLCQRGECEAGVEAPRGRQDPSWLSCRCNELTAVNSLRQSVQVLTLTLKSVSSA